MAITTIVALALPAGANTGHVTASQTCRGWSVTVTLDNNTTPDHFVEVTTTIPGTTGIVDGHYDTTGNSGPTQIWHETGSAPSSGKVTLTILNPDRSLDSTTSATLPDAGTCEPTTTSSSTSTSSTTASTSTTTSTTTGPTSTIGATSTTASSVGERGSTANTSTTVAAVTATLGVQGPTVTTTTIGPTATSTGSLPFTGSGTMVPAIFGLSSIAAGALLLLRKRTTV